MSFFRELEARIDEAMQADRHRLRQMLRSAIRDEQAGRPPDQGPAGQLDGRLDKLQSQLDDSVRRREARAALVPRIVYDESLPVVARREEIAEAIREHQVVVVCGETGSGKSTQLPKICLEIGRGVAGLIGHTQPRRIAARSVAARVAEELGTSVGKKVGFKIRFADATGPETLIKVMTDGVLLAESQHDRFFDQYDTLILDEAHERSLNIDFLLGYLKRLLPRRRDLRLIITSATIDAERFAQHFASEGPEAPAPIIEVSGRTYPVEVRYRPPEGDDGEEELEPIQHLFAAIDEVCNAGAGDLLVFLPTERDILDVSHKLRGRRVSGGTPEILPLYARLSTAEQNRVFEKHGGRRIVLATNVAESSLTVPGIRYVVDTGTARISRYSARSKVQRLPIEAVSQASANQRAGRCGRIGPGICIRLFSEDDFLNRDRFTSPEIQRTNLAAVILQLLALDLGRIDDFPFLDPPRPEAIRDGYKDLFELGAIDAERQLTPLGRKLARLPVDPRIGRMILAADSEGALADVLVIAAGLEVQDPRERPVDKQQAADAAHAQWAHPDSDFLGWIALWDFVQHLREATSRGQFRKACKQHFLSEVRLREWQDVHRQLVEMAGQAGLKIGKRRWRASPVGDTNPAGAKPNAAQAESYAAIHRSLLAGLLSGLALRGETNEYTAAGGGKFLVWPGSSVVAGKPRWIVAAELVETTRRYLRTVARIDPEWIEPLAGHLVSRSYSDPHWVRSAGSAMASEKVSLYGLPIVPRRSVRYGAIDPAKSRDLLIEEGLVAGEIDTRAEFYKRNCDLLANLGRLAAKLRRRELIIDPHVLYRFYDSRLALEVCDAVTLDKWLRRAGRQAQESLQLTEADLLEEADGPVQAQQFPDELVIDRLKLPLSYRFEPGGDDDGITVTLPAEAVPQLSPERVEWLVPGLVEEKVLGLIRSLPKDIRRKLGPAPNIAADVARELKFAHGALASEVAAALSRRAGERITSEHFDTSKLAPHLRLQIRVVDDRGKPLVASRDFDTVRSQAAPPPDAKSPAPGLWDKRGLTKWDFGSLTERVDVRRAGVTLTKYPGIVDAGETVSLGLYDTPQQAAEATRLGALRLFVLSERRELKAQVQWLPQIEKIRLYAAPLRRSKSIDEELIDLLASRAFYAATSEVPRDADEFAAQRLVGKRNIVPAVQDLSKLVLSLFESYHTLQLALQRSHPAGWKYAVDDIRQQVDRLLAPGFLTATPGSWLQHYPRYLRAANSRLTKLSSGQARDRKQHELLAPRMQVWERRAADNAARGGVDSSLDHYRWMLEELRVSLFAQELGTSCAVSPQRLDKLADAFER
jgi:ATP-dependent helicase HrpA